MEKVERKPANPVPMRSLTDPFSLPIFTDKIPKIYPLSKDVESKKPRRKLSDEILISIFEMLRDAEGYETVNRLAKNAKINKQKAISYLELIEWIQRQPKVYGRLFEHSGRLRKIYTIHKKVFDRW